MTACSTVKVLIRILPKEVFKRVMIMSRLLSVLLALSVLVAVPSWGGEKKVHTSYADIVKESEAREGFLPLYWHEMSGKLYARIVDFEQPFIYYTSLSQGVGSNDLGLDRGRLGETHLVQFERVGPKVLLIALNTRYTATSDSEAERRAVDEAFARSILWGFEVAADSADTADGVLIDVTTFALQDNF